MVRDAKLGCNKWFVFRLDNHQWIDVEKRRVVTDFRPRDLRQYQFLCGTGEFRRKLSTELLGTERPGTAYLCYECLVEEGLIW